MFHYERESRTANSEVYVIENEAGSTARADLHYASTIVYGTVCVPGEWSEDDIQDVIADLDERIVRSASRSGRISWSPCGQAGRRGSTPKRSRWGT